jgi:hypothetical protein
VFQIGLGAEFGDAPCGEFASQKGAKPFAKDQAFAAQFPILTLRARQIDQNVMLPLASGSSASPGSRSAGLWEALRKRSMAA